MAKKHFGRFVALAAIAGTAAVGISYFLRYKSFHKELDEDFHDFEDDFDEDLKEFGDAKDTGKAMIRNYVPLNTDRQAEKECTCFGEDEENAEPSQETPPEPQPDGSAASETPASQNDAPEVTASEPTDEIPSADAAVSETASEAESGSSLDEQNESLKKFDQPATIIVEDTTE